MVNLYILEVLINRNVKSFTRTFEYAYYSTKPLQNGVRVKVLFGSKNKNKADIGFVTNCTKLDISLEEYSKKKEYKIKEILEVVDEDPIVNDCLYKLALKMSEYYFTPLNLVLDTILPPHYSLKLNSLNKSKGRFREKVYLNENLNLDDVSLSEDEKRLINKIKEAGFLNKSSISAKKSLEKLLSKSILVIKKEQILYDSFNSTDYNLSNLNSEQQTAFEKIKNTSKDVFLLHGVTGSGKSEIFIHLAYENYKNDKSTLILVPEIVLTEELSNKLRSIFQDDLYIIHSNLTNSTRFKFYSEIKRKQKVVIIGARSALFSPVNNLGHIIIDEEHSVYAYKNESMPSYHAFKVSQFLNELTNCKIVLASATPLVEDLARAKKGLYDYYELKNKYNDESKRFSHLVDMSKGDEIVLDQVIFGKTTLEYIDKVVKDKKQVLILLNRRAYNTIIQCDKCNRIVKCPNCSQSLVYYQNTNICKCNCCDYKISYDELECSNCHEHNFHKYGYGTQKVLDTLKLIRPKYRLLRLDSDLNKKNEKLDVINQFSNNEADILIGTELIAKGHNFKNCKLVVSLDTDFLFSIPCYNANELCFDLLMQFFGRVGRFGDFGECLIQTYQPENPVLNFALNEDYNSFYDYEMNLRKLTLNPPYVYQIKITIKSTNHDKLVDASLKIKNHLKVKIGDKSNIYGPTQPYHFKINNVYLLEILIKYRSRSSIEQAIREIYDLNLDSQIDFSIDVDPIEN